VTIRELKVDPVISKDLLEPHVMLIGLVDGEKVFDIPLTLREIKRLHKLMSDAARDSLAFSAEAKAGGEY